MQVQSEYHGYFLTECIKQHEYGAVYLGATSEDAAPEFIIKIFNTQLISLRERQRFLQEVNVLGSLRHPALLPLLDAGLDKGEPYLVRAYAPEGSLITQLSQQDGQSFPLSTTMAILTRIGAAITYLHEEQVYHGNIKPENILFDANKQAMLSDIHVASTHPDVYSIVYEPVKMGRELVPWGPTVVQDDRKNGMQDDIYALSSMAYELFTGYQPFTSASERDMAPVPPSHWTPSLSEEVDQVFLRALSPHPEDRFSSATLFVGALQHALDSSRKVQVTPLDEPEPIVPAQPPVAQREIVPFQPQNESQRSLPVRLSTRQHLHDQPPVRRRASISSVKLPLIILVALLILASILVPVFLFRPHSNTINAHTTKSQALPAHITSLATSQPSPAATPFKHQNPAPTSTPTPKPTLIPTPHPTPTPLPTPTVVNASFEVPALMGSYAYAPNNSGWTFSNDSGIASNGSNLSQGTSNAPGGTQAAFIQSYGTMSQNVSFVQGTYKLSFLAAQRVSTSSSQTLWVLIDNTVVGTFTPVGGNYLYYSTLGFTVSSGIHTLQFKGLKGGAHNTVFIDSVAITRG